MLLSVAGCDSATEPAYGEERNIRSIAWLRSLVDHRQSIVVHEDIEIRGRITANDRFGEFYRRLVIEDATGAITVAVECSELFLHYPFGSHVTLLCNGLTLNDYGGKIEIGDGVDEYGACGITERDMVRRLHVETPPDSPPVPATVSIGDIDMRLTDCYVRLDGIRFSDGGTWCDFDPETQRHITTEHEVIDTAGNTLTVRTPSTVHYANEPIPSGTGSLCGIIDYFGGRFSLRVTNREILFR